MLYVGKAKRLKSRVRSYFAADFDDSPKNRLLQRLIADVETIVVPSEAAVADPREQPDQGVPAPVQRPAQGRQELSLDRGDAGRPVPARARHPPARHPGRALLRTLHRRRPAPAHAGDHPPALHRPELRRRPARASAGSGPASTTTSAAASRRASAGRAEEDYRRMVDGRGRLPRGPDRGRAGQGARGRCWRPARARTSSAPREHARRAPLARPARGAGQRRGDGHRRRRRHRLRPRRRRRGRRADPRARRPGGRARAPVPRRASRRRRTPRC